MDLIYVGKIVNTHGIKGELRIISDFKFKNEVFISNNSLYINNNKYIIKSYRPHKIYDMVVLEGIDSIEKALELKGSNVYIKKSEYSFDDYLDEELIGLYVYDKDIYKGKVIDIMKTTNNDILVIKGTKKHMVPLIPEFVKNVDLENNKIYIEYIKGLDYED